MILSILRSPILARSVIAILLPSILGSCGSNMIPHKPKVRVSDPSSADKLFVYDSAGEEVDDTDQVFRANSMHDVYTIERLKKGYMPDYQILRPNAVNPMLAVDALVLAGGIALLPKGDTDDLTQSQLDGRDIRTSFAAFVILAGGAGLLFGTHKTYKGPVSLPEMDPLPRHVPGSMQLYVDNVGLKLPGEKASERYFPTFAAYESDLAKEDGAKPKKDRSTFSVKSMESIDASIVLNRTLAEMGYLDSTSSVSRMGAGSNMLHGEVVEWRYNKVAGKAYSFRLTIRWELKDNISKETILERSVVANSQLMTESRTVGIYRKGFLNAMTKGMVEFMGSAGFSEAMADKREKFKATVDAWSPITISPARYSSRKVAELSKSIATVKTKDGHGSGVFVSPDGWLVTNLHVAGKQTDDLEIVLSDGSKLKGRVERSNPVYDLALVKVDGFKGSPVGISTSRETDLGDPAFAVGTPTDLTLGQTITRGIISGKRSFGGLDFIQTDVSINPGNSGGALLNEAGLLVGIVNAKIVGTGVEGMGFAIPTYYLEEALKLVIK